MAIFLKNALFLYHSLHHFFFNSIIYVEKRFSVEHYLV